MSRTIRRKNAPYNGNRGYKWSVRDVGWEKINGRWYRTHLVYEPDTIEYKKGISEFHRDDDTIGYSKEPGPAWYRNMLAERPLRRKHKNELRKAILDDEYEPDVVAKGKLTYWT